MSDPKFIHTGTPSTRAIEECSELIQAICKAERFGWHNTHPTTGETNFDAVRREMDDVVESIERLQEHMRAVNHAYNSRSS